jgi:hypothetical protein
VLLLIDTGWMRMCLQVLFFAPVNLLEPEESFGRFAGRLIVSPVVRVLVFSKVCSDDGSFLSRLGMPDLHRRSTRCTCVGIGRSAAASACGLPLCSWVKCWADCSQCRMILHIRGGTGEGA